MQLPTENEVRDELRRLLESDELTQSSALQQFLSFVVDAVLDGRADEIKEQTIAVQVFGRRDDFDGRIDTIVRVQAHRLRDKLDRYYRRVAEAGEAGSWRITLPRGSYCPHFEPLDSANAAPPAGPTDAASATEAVDEPTETTRAIVVDPPREPGRGRWAIAAVLAVAAVAAAAGGYHYGRSTAPRSSLPALDPNVAALWESFLHPSDQPVLIIYNPTIFLSNSSVLLRYDGPYEGPTDTPISRDNPYLTPFVDPNALQQFGPFVFNYSWGPTGVVAQTYYLTDMLALGGRRAALRSSRRLETSDAVDRDVILLGRFALEELWNIPPFTFEQPVATGETSGPPALPQIRNHRPAPGEPEVFSVERDEATQAREIDYGFFAMAPAPRGARPGRRVAVCTGISTFGAWGAAQFMTSSKGARAILDRLGSPPPPYFQAIVRATIDRETIQSVELVAARAVEPSSLEPTAER